MLNLKPVTATYAFDTFASSMSPPPWLKIDSDTGIISGRVSENAPVGTTKYIIKITGTKEYSDSPEQRLEFVLTLKIADFPNPLGVSVQDMTLRKNGNAAERSGNSMIIDANNTKLTVTYSYSPDNSRVQPSWLSLNQNTGEITVNNADPDHLPNIGDTKIYKIRITGTGIYEDKTSDIDFIILVAAVLPATLAYDSQTFTQGAHVLQTIKGRGGISSFTYAFAATPAKPAWLNIDPNTGTISGRVPASESTGTTTYKIIVSGSSGSVYDGETREISFYPYGIFFRYMFDSTGCYLF